MERKVFVRHNDMVLIWEIKLTIHFILRCFVVNITCATFCWAISSTLLSCFQLHGNNNRDKWSGSSPLAKFPLAFCEGIYAARAFICLLWSFTLCCFGKSPL